LNKKKKKARSKEPAGNAVLKCFLVWPHRWLSEALALHMGLRGIIAPMKRNSACNHFRELFVEPVVYIIVDISATLSLGPEAGIAGLGDVR
jgi:hypothetical protein